MSLLSNENRVLGNSMLKWVGVYLKIGNKLKSSLQIVECNYKFSRDGGAVGDISLKDEDGTAVSLPIGTIVTCATWITKTPLTSGGSATVKVKDFVGSNDVHAAAIAYNHATIDQADEKLALVPVQATPSTWVGPLAAAVEPKLTIGTADLTAGEVSVFLWCFKRN